MAKTGQRSCNKSKPAHVGREGWTLLRLQFCPWPFTALSVLSHLLSVVGRIRNKGTGRTSGAEFATIRAGGRAANEHLRQRQSVGFAVRLGTAADDCGGRAETVWLYGRRREN